MEVQQRTLADRYPSREFLLNLPLQLAIIEPPPLTALNDLPGGVKRCEIGIPLQHSAGEQPDSDHVNRRHACQIQQQTAILQAIAPVAFIVAFARHRVAILYFVSGKCVHLMPPRSYITEQYRVTGKDKTKIKLSSDRKCRYNIRQPSSKFCPGCASKECLSAIR